MLFKIRRRPYIRPAGDTPDVFSSVGLLPTFREIFTDRPKQFGGSPLSSPVSKAALLFLVCLLWHAAGSWNVPLIDRDEPRFAEASREMRARGDYVVPYFNNDYRFDKPPLIYWSQVGSYHLFGENDFAARFPSMVATALTAVVLFAWGRRLGHERIGWWSAIIFSLCLQMFLFGRAALADIWLVFFVTAAHSAAFELLRDSLGAAPSGATSYPKSWQVVFYSAIGLAFLAKGFVGWIPLLTVASTKLFLRRQRLAPRFRFTIGILGTLAIILAWGIPALLRTDGEFFRVGFGHHVLERAVGTAAERQEASFAIAYFATLPFYFLAVFVSFFPWSIKLPALIRRVWRRRDGIDNYLIAGILPLFLILTLVRTKYFHYTLPAFPLLSLLLARHLFELPGAARFARRAAIVTMTVFLSINLFLLPFFADVIPSVQLFKQAQADLRPEMEFGNVGPRQPSAVWYFRSRVRGWSRKLKPAKVKKFMNLPGARFVVLPSQTANELYPQLPPDWKSYTARGFLPLQGKRLDLTLVLKP